MTRLVLFPGLSGRVLGAVSAVRAALSRAGGKARVDKAAQEEALRLSLADAARRRVHVGGRHGRRPAGDLGFGPPGRSGVPRGLRASRAWPRSPAASGGPGGCWPSSRPRAATSGWRKCRASPAPWVMPVAPGVVRRAAGLRSDAEGGKR